MDSVSLRKKRSGKPQISAPTFISGPLPAGAAKAGPAASSGARRPPRSGAGLPQGPRARERPQNGADKTADLVKRRYSTRFTGLPQDFGDAPPLPSVPAMQDRFAVQRPRDTEDRPVAGGKRIQVDARTLGDPKFEAQQYVAAILSDASEDDIQEFQAELRQLKTRADTDLQQNVFQNRTQFIKISKEAEKLNGELRTLKNLMSELTVALGQAATAGGASNESFVSRRKANRSSVANLEALWNTHLQTLWKRVEGSQKYLPAIPGRHIVYESSRWVELNAATWKPRRRVHIILLNDHFLIATEKKRPDTQSKDASPMPLVATKCWPLQDVQIADLSTRATPGGAEKTGSTNAINVRVGTDSFTFATGSQEAGEKVTLLSTFRKAMEDLRRNLDVESQDRDKNQASATSISSPLLRPSPYSDPFADSLLQKSDMIIDVDGKPQNIRWVESQVDDLDIDIALQRFEEAVARIETLRRAVDGIKANAIVQAALNLKLNERASKLAGAITRSLADTHSWLTATQRCVDWLTRLGFEDGAREAYLEARSQIIRKRIRQVIFDGDLHQYIYQISFIYFTIIKHTAQIFQSCFPAVMMSACVKWAKEHVDNFNALLERQLSSVDETSQIWKDCMERAQAHAAMLGDVGLDFKDLIGKTSPRDNERT